MQDRNNRNNSKRKTTHQRTFEVTIDSKTESHLSYFIRQELGYYNTIVEQLIPRLRAFPYDLISMKDREKNLWASCAEKAVDPQKLIDYPIEQWPAHLKDMYSLIKEQDGTVKITPAHANVIKIAASPARLHASVRKIMSLEILRHVINQAEIFQAATLSVNEELKVPVQMLQTHTLDTKRHLQIPKALVKITSDGDETGSYITIPYSNNALFVPNHDLRENQFKMLVVRAPHPATGDGQWHIDLKDYGNYQITLTDHNERKRRYQK